MLLISFIFPKKNEKQINKEINEVNNIKETNQITWEQSEQFGEHAESS